MRNPDVGQLHLGASMYSPATLDVDTLVNIADGLKYPSLRSIIFDTEDSVRNDELYRALHNLKHMLQRLHPDNGPLRFIRVRSPDVFGKIVRMEHIERIDGFVLPKITADNLPHYLVNLRDDYQFSLMPTLETVEAFDNHEMKRLRKMMLEPSVRDRILCLRIGGNDLNGLLRVRRPVTRTIYETAVGSLIKELARTFIPHGFGMTSVVFEGSEPAHLEVLKEEVELDLLQGLLGKTIVHPLQKDVVENGLKVDAQELEDARQIADREAKAVFKRGGRMCEPATHRSWAGLTIERANVYGVRE